MIKINITVELNDKDKNNIFTDYSETKSDNNIKIVKKKPKQTKIIKVNNTKELLKRIYIEIPIGLRTI